MGIISGLKKILGRKKEVVEEPIPRSEEGTKEELPLETPALREEKPLPLETIPQPPTPPVEGNLRTKLDLISAQIDSLKMQNQMIIDRLKNLEKMIAELRGIRYY